MRIINTELQTGFQRRKGLWRRFRNWRARWYGRCGGCGDSCIDSDDWPLIHYGRIVAMRPLCRDCFTRMTPAQILHHCEALVAKWESVAWVDIQDVVRASVRELKGVR